MPNQWRNDPSINEIYCRALWTASPSRNWQHWINDGHNPSRNGADKRVLWFTTPQREESMTELSIHRTARRDYTGLHTVSVRKSMTDIIHPTDRLALVGLTLWCNAKHYSWINDGYNPSSRIQESEYVMADRTLLCRARKSMTDYSIPCSTPARFAVPNVAKQNSEKSMTGASHPPTWQTNSLQGISSVEDYTTALHLAP
jgi:hypothetical protein